MKTVTIKSLTIDEDTPRIIVSLMGKDIATIKSRALAYHRAGFGVLRWRVDHFTDVSSIEAVLEATRAIRDVMTDKPLLFTFRNAKGDGEQALSIEHYVAFNRAAVDSGLVGMIGLELFTGDELVKATIEHAHAKDVFVIMSNHDSHKTPAAEEIVQRLRKIRELGADIPGIALMPQNKTDVLTLPSATLEMQERYAGHPIATMSMAKTRVVSCLSGEVLDSTATFGTVKKTSVPGQISVTDLRTVLTILHQA